MRLTNNNKKKQKLNKISKWFMWNLQIIIKKAINWLISILQASINLKIVTKTCFLEKTTKKKSVSK